MKSKTSCFSGCVLRKDITRFAPVWGLYSVFLLLLALVLNGIRLIDGSRFAIGLSAILRWFPQFMFAYALVVAEVLLGDLDTPRMANALHAMPLRREGWLLTHIAAGLLFALVPSAVFTAVAALLCGKFAATALWWLLGVMLQYIFFFGLAVLCGLLTGNRFAMALLYIGANFLSELAYLMIATLYIPLLPGVLMPWRGFGDAAPVIGISMRPYLEPSYLDGYGYGGELAEVLVADGWGYLAGCALVGVGMMGLAFVAYRRRALERAGDLIVFRWLRPVFLVLYTLAAGTVCRAFFGLILGYSSVGSWIMLALGVAIGFFTGEMLLSRSARVFTGRNLAKFAVLAAVLALSLVLTKLDVCGLVCYVPKPEQVASIEVSYQNETLTVTDAQQIEALTKAHALLTGTDAKAVDPNSSSYSPLDTPSVKLTYRMANGWRVLRGYTPYRPDQTEALRPILSQPELALRMSAEEFAQKLVSAEFPRAQFNMGGEGSAVVTEDMDTLAGALAADCAAGTMAQGSKYHLENARVTYLVLEVRNGIGGSESFSVDIYTDAKNTCAWLRAHGFVGL